MEEDKKINLVPHEGEPFLGLCMPQPCENCGHSIMSALYDMQINGRVVTICKNCLEKLHEEIGQTLHKSVRLNDTIWELVYCDDKKWRIFPMVVKSVCIYGSVTNVKGKGLTTWNIYAEGDTTYTYKSFYDIGKTLFFTEEDAKAALAKKEGV